MSLKEFIKEYTGWKDSLCNFSSNTDEFVHPNNWLIYKYHDETENENTYTLCLDYLGVEYGVCISMLSRYDIVSLDENITMNISDDDNECEIITEKYTYKFKKSYEYHTIKNALGGFYNTYEIQLVEVKNKNKTVETKEKYHLELDKDILNFYLDGEYLWSKIISLKYTNGIYFVLRDKIFTVIDNGCGILNVYNLDGSEYKTINTNMEYIQCINITSNEKFLKLEGFIWNPIYIKELISIDSIFEGKIKYKTCWDGDDDDEFNNFNSDIDEEEFSYDE